MGVDICSQDSRPYSAMCAAVRGGHISTLVFLHMMGAEFNERGWHGETLMHRAAKLGNTAIIRELHQLECDVNAQDFEENTPMHVAADKGRLDAIKTLHELAGRMTIKNERGETPLHLAAPRGNCDAINLMVPLGAKTHKRRIDGGTALFVAAAKGHNRAIQALHKLGADVACKDDEGNTPLIIAAARGHCTTVAVLFDLGASLEDKNIRGDSAAMVAVKLGRVSVLSMLHRLGAVLVPDEVSDPELGDADHCNVSVITSASSGDNSTTASAYSSSLVGTGCVDVGVGPLCETIGSVDSGVNFVFAAALHDRGDIIRLLHMLGCDISRCSDGVSPLVIAASNDCVDVITALHRLGEDVNRACPAGYRPLLVAAAEQKLGAVAALVDLGADIDSQNERGETALCLAAQRGHGVAVRLLRKLGACPTIRSNTGYLPFHLAADAGHVNVLRVMRELGEPLESLYDCERPGSTALYLAVEKGHLASVKTLHALGADLDIATIVGDPTAPTELGSRLGHCLSYLISNGANITPVQKEVVAQLREFVRARSDSGTTAGTTALQRKHLLCLVKLMSSTHIGQDHLGAWEGEEEDSEVDMEEELARELELELQEEKECSGATAKQAFEEAVIAGLLEPGRPTHCAEFVALSFPHRSTIARFSAGAYHSARSIHGRHSRLHSDPVHLLRLFFDHNVLRDLHSLRHVCRCCYYEHRFPLPVCVKGHGAVVSLGVGLIESFIGGEMACFVTTGVVSRAVACFRVGIHLD